jgi:hypothetical protein
MEVGIHGQNRFECTVICDAAEGCAIRWPLEEMSEGGFHEIDELLIGGVLGPAPLKVAYAFGQHGHFI